MASSTSSPSAASSEDCVPRVEIKKESPEDEIKEYAETAMNELLGWYGYEKVDSRDTQGLDLHHFASVSRHARRRLANRLPAHHHHPLTRGVPPQPSSSAAPPPPIPPPPTLAPPPLRPPPHRPTRHTVRTTLAKLPPLAHPPSISSEQSAADSDTSLSPSSSAGSSGGGGAAASEGTAPLTVPSALLGGVRVKKERSESPTGVAPSGGTSSAAAGALPGCLEDPGRAITSPTIVDARYASSSSGSPQSPGGATASESQQQPPLLCSWCGRPAGNLPITAPSTTTTLSVRNGGSSSVTSTTTKAFCSEVCFTQCRRASFKRSKACDWCRHVRHTVAYVDFQDGETQLQFCSDKCLNQYKMNIFCKETQAHLAQLKAEASGIAPGRSSGAGGPPLIITPDLWMRDCCERADGGDGSQESHEEDEVDEEPFKTTSVDPLVAEEEEKTEEEMEEGHVEPPPTLPPPPPRIPRFSAVPQQRFEVTDENTSPAKERRRKKRRRKSKEAPAPPAIMTTPPSSHTAPFPQLPPPPPAPQLPRPPPPPMMQIHQKTPPLPPRPLAPPQGLIPPMPPPPFLPPHLPPHLSSHIPLHLLPPLHEAHFSRFVRPPSESMPLHLPHPNHSPHPHQPPLPPRVPPLPLPPSSLLPPVTMLVPYPIILPIPVPIPIPIPVLGGVLLQKLAEERAREKREGKASVIDADEQGKEDKEGEGREKKDNATKEIPPPPSTTQSSAENRPLSPNPSPPTTSPSPPHLGIAPPIPENSVSKDKVLPGKKRTRSSGGMVSDEDRRVLVTSKRKFVPV